MSGTMVPYGNIQALALVSLTISVSAVSANAVEEKSFPCPGVKVGDIVVGVSTTLPTSLGVVGARVTAANVAAITFFNNTASPITPSGSLVFNLLVARPDSLSVVF